MSEAKFTKGDWLVWQYHDDADFAPRRADHIIIGMSTYNEDPRSHYTIHKILLDGEEGDDEMIANAHLIAAAPEMYEMLEELQEVFFKNDSSDCTWNEIDTLLAKARGETK